MLYACGQKRERERAHRTPHTATSQRKERREKKASQEKRRKKRAATASIVDLLSGNSPCACVLYPRVRQSSVEMERVRWCVPLSSIFYTSLQLPLSLTLMLLLNAYLQEQLRDKLICVCFDPGLPCGSPYPHRLGSKKKVSERETLKYYLRGRISCVVAHHSALHERLQLPQLSGSVHSPTYETKLKQGPLQEAIIILRYVDRDARVLYHGGQVNIE